MNKLIVTQEMIEQTKFQQLMIAGFFLVLVGFVVWAIYSVIRDCKRGIYSLSSTIGWLVAFGFCSSILLFGVYNCILIAYNPKPYVIESKIRTEMNNKTYHYEVEFKSEKEYTAKEIKPE